MRIADVLAGKPAANPIDPRTRLGHVRLVVNDLDRVSTFYQDVLGFREHRRDSATAALGAGGEDLLRLTANRDARYYRRAGGLYHTAFLVPERVDLAQWLRRIAETETPIQGMVDHWTHEAIYLPDPEGNGIELAWDRPRDQWPTFTDLIARGNGQLDPQDLIGEITDPDAPWVLNAAAQVGHVHLHAGNLELSDGFYRDVLGFDGTVTLPGQMSFVAAGGYHHHIGYNLWRGAGIPPRPADAAGIDYLTVILPDRAARDRVLERVTAAGLTASEQAEGVLLRDPAGVGVLLTVAA